MKSQGILLGCCFVVCIGVSIANQRVGAAAFGLFQFAIGCVVVYRQEIGFGVQGFAPAGYIKGVPAILLGIVFMALGLLLTFWPKALGW